MAQQGEEITNRVVDIIANIKIGQKSGQLTLRRGEGLTVEEGILIFVQGQVTQAKVGRRSGSDAVNWISTWRQARYIFQSTTPDGEVATVFAAFSSAAEKDTGPLGVERLNSEEGPRPASPEAAFSEIPHATVNLSMATATITRMQLPRPYRTLFLLIDGQRSVDEIVPLMGKSAAEVQTMLRTLIWLGIVQMGTPPPERR